MKLWNIEIFLLDEAGNSTDASIFTKAVYNLHPSFANPVQSKSFPSFFPHCAPTCRYVSQMADAHFPMQPLIKRPSAAKMRDGENSI
jgi:hypothetical protein